jgi:hypothetical protein
MTTSPVTLPDVPGAQAIEATDSARLLSGSTIRAVAVLECHRSLVFGPVLAHDVCGRNDHEKEQHG